MTRFICLHVLLETDIALHVIRTVHCTTTSLHRWRSQRPVWQTTSRVVLRLPINPERAPENQLIFYARHKSLLPSFVLAGSVTVTGRPQGPPVTGTFLPWYFVSLRELFCRFDKSEVRLAISLSLMLLRLFHRIHISIFFTYASSSAFELGLRKR